MFRAGGWRAVQEHPLPEKAVIIAAPHTSNWDFVYFFGLTARLGFSAHWIGKHTLFRPPWGAMMRRLGGIPIDRRSSQNMVAAMADQFARRDRFRLVIPPEGSRGSVRRWRTGFYYIALAAKVPIVIGMMDYAKKTAGLGPAFMPTGDYEADMAVLTDFYRTVTPRHPDMKMTDIVAASTAPPE